MQGFPIVQNVEYPCRRKISIPAEYAGQRIFLRFDGVYSHARVWINGVYLRDHFGGFTSWDCEITGHAKAGETADLVVGVTDRSDDISEASSYAKHLIAGILRDVRMFAVPSVFLSSFSAPASLDAAYENGLIHLYADISSPGNGAAELRCNLQDSSGKIVALEPATVRVAPGQPVRVQLRVPTPAKWDAEHPNLYTLQVDLVAGGQTTETLTRRIGFRSARWQSIIGEWPAGEASRCLPA